MSEDGHNQDPSANGPASDKADGEDATVQISKAELAAIRQSANNPAMTPEMLREINRRRLQAQASADEEQDSTRTFDRSRLDALLHQDPPTAEVDQDDIDTGVADGALADLAISEAMANADWMDADDDSPGVDPIDDIEELDLDELSDADLHDVVFGGDQPPPIDGLDELSDADLRAVVFGDGEDDGVEVGGDAGVDLPAPQPGEDTGNLDELAELADRTVPANPAPQLEVAPPQMPAARPPAPQPSAPPAPADLMDDAPLETFRSSESRLLIGLGGVGGAALVGAGGARILAEGVLTQIHPVIAGMMMLVGFLMLIGVAVAVLQRR